MIEVHEQAASSRLQLPACTPTAARAPHAVEAPARLGREILPMPAHKRAGEECMHWEEEAAVQPQQSVAAP